MDPFTIAGLGLTAVKGIADLIGGAKQPDPEEIYRKRLAEAMSYLNNAFSGFEIAARTGAERQLAQARRIGGRQQAQLNYTGGPEAFTSSAEASITDRLDATMQDIRAQKTASIANLQVQGLDFPIITKPNAWQTLGAVAGTAGAIAGGVGLMGMSNKNTEDLNAQLEKSVNSVTSSLGGQTQLEGSMNRMGDYGAPAPKSNYAYNSLIFGSAGGPQQNAPLSFSRRYSPIPFSSGRRY
jgi:hypothetical protein